jgi:hypothetical protein
MLHQLWSYFETTGDITMYLSFKEYENEYNNKLKIPKDPINTNEVG